MAEDRPTEDDDTPPGDAVSPSEVDAATPEPEPPGDGAPASAIDPPQEVDAAQAYHQRARLAEDRLAEVLAAYRTIKSENEGFRERISRNLQRRFTQRHETLLLKFIEILDNLDRALEAAQRSYAGEALLEGMILVRTQLLARLQEEGLERIPVLGLAFDPAVSESVAMQPVHDPDHHSVVVKELMRGYRVNGRVVRPSRVVIGVYQEGAAAPVPQAPEPVIDNEPTGAPAPAEAGGEPSLEEILARVALTEPVEEDEDEEEGEPS